MKWKIKKVKVEDLKEWDKNPRAITDDKLEHLITSIQKFGIAEPIVVNTDLVICGGHGRKKALLQLGVKEVDAYVPDKKLTDEQFKELNVRLNKNIAGEWDYDLLAEHFDMEELSDFGFDDSELESIFASMEDDDEETEGDDDVPEGVEPRTKKGDIYVLGNHRLLCGDATMVDDVEKLMDGEKVDMVFTDPPYGLGGYGGRNGMELKNDDADQDMIEKFYDINYYLSFSTEVYVWGNQVNLFKHVNVEPRDTIVWKKNNFGLGSGYRGQYELCFYYGSFNGSDSDVWEIPRDLNYQHPTQKPVNLGIRAIKNSSPKSIILDFFLGSGSTLIAAEKTGRRCFGVELSEKYCDIIVQRYVNFCRDNGKKFKVVRNGQDISGEYQS